MSDLLRRELARFVSTGEVSQSQADAIFLELRALAGKPAPEIAVGIHLWMNAHAAHRGTWANLGYLDPGDPKPTRRVCRRYAAELGGVEAADALAVELAPEFKGKGEPYIVEAVARRVEAMARD